MAIRSITRRQLGDYFRQWIDASFENNVFNRFETAKLQNALDIRLSELVSEINQYGIGRITLSGSDIALLEIHRRIGRDPEKGEFNLFEIHFPQKRKSTKLVCFLGHRFNKAINSSLRHNLRCVLEPSNIELIWAGIDMTASGFFEDIVQKIESADFCLFDNRQTDNRPNVYIEAGIAYALRKPFIFANHQLESARFPSDLNHIYHIPYRNYEELCKRLYFGLPVFLQQARLQKRRL